MIYPRTGTVTGIDYYIHNVQAQLYPAIKSLLGIMDDTSYDCYCRVYRNYSEIDKGYIAEAYKGDNQYTGDLYHDDSKTAISFFDYGGSTIDDGTVKAMVSFIMSIDLSKMNVLVNGNASTDREDEYARWMVLQLIDKTFGFNLKKVITGVDNVLSNFPGTRRAIVNKQAGDMQPYHYFRLDFEVVYTEDNICQYVPVNEY